MNRRQIAEIAASRGLVPSDDVQKQAGVSYRQLDYWCRAGLLEYEGGENSGYPGFFQPEEVAAVELLGRLSARGLSPTSDIAKRAVAAARSGQGAIVTDGPISVFV